jgi:methyl-accepting chemotaxis protein
MANVEKGELVTAITAFLKSLCDESELSVVVAELGGGMNPNGFVSLLDDLRSTLSQVEEARDQARSAVSELESVEYTISQAKDAAEEAESEADSAYDAIQEIIEEMETELGE